jgi:hypothetical protein
MRREAIADAVSALERAKSIQATAEVLTDLGLARRKANDNQRAEAEFRAALQVNPRMTAARLHLASTLATSGRCPEGLQQLSQVQAEPLYADTITQIKQRCDFEARMAAQPQRKK